MTSSRPGPSRVLVPMFLPVLLLLLSGTLWSGTLLAASVAAAPAQERAAPTDDATVRVFLFAGQSNMVGSDSKVADIQRFPPFRGLDQPQPEVHFTYCLGRETKNRSEGWVPLAPVNGIVGPELSFARELRQRLDAPIAIIKVAAGGTHLGGDWNPDQPAGFKMYPLALEVVRTALAQLSEQGLPYRLEGFVWHQGENDMFEPEFMAHYGDNLARFLACWRRDLATPDLPFFIGELCTKTIWGMDLRPRMHAISLGQRQVTESDPLAFYVPTSHVGVEIGGGVGLHYHYGTLGQLQHGVSHAEAYLRTQGLRETPRRALPEWPYAAGSKVRLYVLAGHRNMEGERAFVQELAEMEGGEALLAPNPKVAYRYDLGGGYRVSDGWEPLGPAGFSDTFGPELSFVATLQAQQTEQVRSRPASQDGGSGESIAIATLTHSGSQIIDWTPEGSEATTRNLYPAFLKFVRTSMQQLAARGHQVDLAGIVYHVGENDMSWGPFRQGAPERVRSLITQSRVDLEMPDLKWFVTQQPPTDDERVNKIDVSARMAALAAEDEHWILRQDLDLPPQPKKLVLDTAGVVALGRAMAKAVLENLR